MHTQELVVIVGFVRKIQEGTDMQIFLQGSANASG